MIRKLLAAGAIALTGALLLPAPAQAHPLGNFTTNQYAGLRISGTGVDVDYLLDLAELPAYQAQHEEIDTDRDGKQSRPERDAYAERTCAAAAGATEITIAGRRVALDARPAGLTFPPGTGGLATLRLQCVLHADARIESRTEIGYRGNLFPDRIGWREVTAVGDRYTLDTPAVPADSVSARLTAYPTGMATSDVRSVVLDVRPGGPAAAPAPFPVSAGTQARDVDRFTAWFTDLVGRPELTLGVGVLAFLIAVVLGGAHAVAPGHGKTIMAAYLVGSRGRLRQALTVAVTVAATHTVGVLALGIVLATSVQLAPDAMYRWLQLASGVLVALVGGHLLLRALKNMRARQEMHDHDHDHGGDGLDRPLAVSKRLPTGEGSEHDHNHVHAHAHSEPVSERLPTLVGAEHEHHHDHNHPHEHRLPHPVSERLPTLVGAEHEHHHDHDHPHEHQLPHPVSERLPTRDEAEPEHQHHHAHPHAVPVPALVGKHSLTPAGVGHSDSLPVGERLLTAGAAAEPDHGHDLGHGHGHGHSHGHGPSSSPSHGHGWGPSHGHDHGPSSSHNHDHDHDHDHDPSSSHNHDHDHDHDPSSSHDHDHSPSPDHGHSQGQAVATASRVTAHVHSHGGSSHTHYIPAPDEPLRLRTLLAMGFAGGLSPSPSAVVVLLGAAALGRAWYGVVLVAAYGIGLAATLAGIGLVLARWGERLHRVTAGRWSHLLTRRLPAVTATIILAVGVGMAAVATLGLLGA
ncbi:hypothetical protein [Actinoplanes friuliensis]|uniref:High-affinity nickel-transporter n=1 Tax=Actinoplanes friuliensis DSM 7358 TaxID=1246995 RepID=U5W6W3_9ACTN|nr:hypothetical protein [Actinoplanes friuliensis]AGZ44943.1 hypothetical protein AFR_33425 [Actinoplanes friuliensis DSM 7358]